MTQIQKNISIENAKIDELILVVKREELFSKENVWQGIAQVDFDNYLKILQTKREFLPRSVMEQDATYKQIIPYLIFTHNNKLFLMQRRAKATEARLKNKFSLGIGGHIRQEDMTTDSIIDWSKREFYEEVHYEGNLNVKPLGIINDDSNEVGKVHIGFVFLLEGDTDKISVKSELKNGQLLTYEECRNNYFDDMESWSQIAFNFLMR